MIEDYTKFVDSIKTELIANKKVVILRLGTFTVVPARKGKHYDIMKKTVVTKTGRKWRVKFKPSPILKDFLKKMK